MSSPNPASDPAPSSADERVPDPEERSPDPDVERVASTDDVANPPSPPSPTPDAPLVEPSGSDSDLGIADQEPADEEPADQERADASPAEDDSPAEEGDVMRDGQTDKAQADEPGNPEEDRSRVEDPPGVEDLPEVEDLPGETDSPEIAGPGVLALKDMGESPPRDTCANCEAPLVGPYCSQCGQRAADRVVPLHEMTQEWFEDLFEFDLRIFRTLPTFFFKPGRLTKEYVQGRRVRYVRPLRLYLVASFLLFTVLAFSDVATIDGLDESSDASPPADLIRTSGTEDGGARTSTEGEITEDEIAEAKRRASRPDEVGMSVGASGSEASSSRTIDPERLRRELQALDSLGRADPAAIDSIVNVHVGTATETFTREMAQGRDSTSASGADTPDDDSTETGDGDSFASEQQRRKVAEEVTNDMTVNLSFIQDETQRQEAEQYVKNRVAQTIIDPNGFIRGMIDRAPYVMFLLLPLFALLLKLLYIRRGKLYIQHLIFALHIHAFIFLTFALSTGLLVSDIPSLQTVGGWLTLVPLVYVYFAMQHVYGQGWIKTAVKMFVLFTLYNTVLGFGILILAIANLLLM